MPNLSDPMNLVLPIEKFVPPVELNGQYGENRLPEGAGKQIRAENDLDALNSWLCEYRHSPQTFRTYRKEAERLLLWSIIEMGKPLSSLRREDLMRYEDFIADPQPAIRWCGAKITRSSGKWRPFEGPLSPASQRQALIILDSMFSYLVSAGYLTGNPLSLMRRRRTPLVADDRSVERYLDRQTWHYLLDYIHNLPIETERQIEEKERILFLFSLLYLMGPRLNEVASHAMNSFFERRGKWWWRLTGKGNKLAIVPVPAEAVDALSRYRIHLGMPSLPTPNDETPLILSVKGRKKIGSGMIYKIVKKFVMEVAAAMHVSDPTRSDKLKQASTHWFRHTAITHQADAGIELRYIKKSARHAKIDTTALYLHSDNDSWHDAVQMHQMRKVIP